MIFRQRKKFGIFLLCLGFTIIVFSPPWFYNKDQDGTKLSTQCLRGQNLAISSHRVVPRGGSQLHTQLAFLGFYFHLFFTKHLIKRGQPSCLKIRQTSIVIEHSCPESFEFCSLSTISNGSPLLVSCLEDSRCTPGLYLGMATSPLAVELNWEHFSSAKSLVFYIRSLMDLSNAKDHYGFLFIKCYLTDKEKSAVAASGQQLLVLPPKLKILKRVKPTISVQLVILPAMSREEMYSHLPDTVAQLTKLNKDTTSHTDILDYQMVQDLGSRRDNLESLLAGEVTSRERIRAQHLLGHYSAQGFNSRWEESVCWYSNKTSLLHYLETGEEQKIEDKIYNGILLAGIHSLGVSPSLCHLPHSCPSFLLSHLINSSLIHNRQMSSHHQPHISLLFLPSIPDLTLDLALNFYLHQMSSLSNTITVLTSSSSPSTLPLFIMVPHRVRNKLTQDSWQSLITNQDRLTSLLDLHLSLLYLINPHSINDDIHPNFTSHYVFSSKGLMVTLPLNRSCSSLPRTKFNCQCSPSIISNLPGRLISDVTRMLSVSQCHSPRKGSGELISHGMGDRFSRVNIVGGGTVTTDRETRSVMVEGDWGCDWESRNVRDYIEIEKHVKDNKIESLFVEEGIECLTLIGVKQGPVVIVQLASLCQSVVVLVIEFSKHTSFSLVDDEIRVEMLPDSLVTANMFLSDSLDQLASEELPTEPPSWDFMLIDVHYKEE